MSDSEYLEYNCVLIDEKTSESRLLLHLFKRDYWKYPADQIVGLILRQNIKLLEAISFLLSKGNYLGVDHLVRGVFESSLAVMYILNDGERKKNQRARAYEYAYIKDRIEGWEDMIKNLERHKNEEYKQKSLERTKNFIKDAETKLENPHLCEVHEEYKKVCQVLKNNRNPAWYNLFHDAEKKYYMKIIDLVDMIGLNSPAGVKHNNINSYKSLYKPLSKIVHGGWALMDALLTPEGEYMWKDTLSKFRVEQAVKLTILMSNLVYEKILSFYTIEEKEIYSIPNPYNMRDRRRLKS